MDIRNRIGKEILVLDGACGTALQTFYGLGAGELPETWCFKKPEVIEELHTRYLESGADIILTNTFGANFFKFQERTTEYIKQAVKIARKAADKKKGSYVALDIGPTGKLMKPIGDLSFEDAYKVFEEIVVAGKGVDLIMIETMSDLYEMKAAILAAKENSDLPIIASVTLDDTGKTLTGGDIETVATLLEGLSVDVIGLNCGFGPNKMIGWVKKLRQFTNLPIMIKPNAGMPVIVNGKLQYDITSDEFARLMKQGVEEGAHLIGGCCGTTPSYIAKLFNIKRTASIKPIEKKVFSKISSYGKTVNFENAPLVIGERINPTGKKLLKEALRNDDMEYVKSEAVRQIEAGAHILDVNVGLPGVDEVEMLSKAVMSVQSVTDLPLQIDTSNVEALEKALRIYNGVPLINSVNGKLESMKEVFPLAKKYGAMIVGLTLDEKGIDETVEGRIKVAKTLVDTADSYGIGKEKLLIDPLAMTISTGPNNAKTVLEIIDVAKNRLDVKTVLGVSNISFGLPNRQNINAVFFAQVLSKGLNAGIIDPTSDAMMSVYYSFLALAGKDENCEKYIAKFGVYENKETPSQDNRKLSLEQAVIKGLSKEAIEKTETLLKDGMAPLDVVSNILMPALDKIGEDFEKGTIFLPQLLSSAESAKAAFNVINTSISSSGITVEKKGEIILATVEGDIHDIGKNIVKVVLENYGYEIIDLGRDAKIDKVVDVTIKYGVKLVGLSALMTTTVDNMRKTIEKLREKTDCKIMVGGAVLTPEYANEIGADYYAKDALASVKIAEDVFKSKQR